MDKIIKNFILDLSDLPAATERRNFTVVGEEGSEFKLEIKNEDSYYYNFVTNAFQATKTSLEEKITNGSYRGSIVFPTVTDDDHYDVYLWAKAGTRHSDYVEKRFGDDTVDINSSTGSNSLLMQKIIYQYTDVTLSITSYSPNSTVGTSAVTTDTITASRGRNKTKTSFSITATSSSGECFQIIKQPTINDFISFVTTTVGSTPEALPGENIHPAVSDTDTVDGDFTAGSSNKIVMDTNVANKMVVGDKVTAAISTDTVDGTVASGQKIVMDNNVAGKMSVGDRVTGISGVPDTTVVLVTHLNPDSDNVKEFQVDLTLSGSYRAIDSDTLTFTPKCNRSLTTVAVLNPDDDNVKEFQMSQAIGFTDGHQLSFSNQKYYQWPLASISNIQPGMSVFATANATANSVVSKYEDLITTFENTPQQVKFLNNSAPALTTKGQKPTVVKGIVTVQPGNVVFNKQQALVLAGDGIRIGGYGKQEILKNFDYDLEITNLKVELTAVTTTTTAASYDSTSIVVAARDGILNSVSTISGIGIDPSAAAPTVSSGASATGAGTIVAGAAQTLESGVTLTFPGAGRVATITGDIEISRAGILDQTLRIDLEKILSAT